MKTEVFIDRQSIAQIIDTAHVDRANFLSESYKSEKVGKAVRRGSAPHLSLIWKCDWRVEFGDRNGHIF